MDGVRGAGMTDIPPCPNSAEDAGSGSANIRIAIIQKTYLVILYRLQKAIKPPTPRTTIRDRLSWHPPVQLGPSGGKFQYNSFQSQGATDIVTGRE